MSIEIRYGGGMRFVIQARDHECVLDLPAPKGGTDVGATPPELFVGALGACIGVYLVDYCERVGLPTEGLALEAAYDTADSPSRISSIRLDIKLPPGIPEARLRALRKVAESCLVHNTLKHGPEIEMTLAVGDGS